jgi:nicotinamidase-related amidase
VRELPIPEHFDPSRTGEVFRVDYAARFEEAARWRERHGLRPADEDDVRCALVAVDCQNTFCLPDFELFVGGRSGTGAVDDTRRLCEFVYRNLGVITQIVPTLDTHHAYQIFHPVFLVDADGAHPSPGTQVTPEDVEAGRWRPSPQAAAALGVDEGYLARHLRYYVETLRRGGKYSLTVWPFHALLGGIGHALVASLEEAIFFHAVARASQPDFQMKGDNSLTEHYSALGPEVAEDQEGEPLGRRNRPLVERLLRFDAVIIAGQAKSHCVAWSIADLLADETVRERGLHEKVYLLEDCTSPVVLPGIVDFTDDADAAFARFAEAGAHVVRSTTPIAEWPGALGERLRAAA